MSLAFILYKIKNLLGQASLLLKFEYAGTK